MAKPIKDKRKVPSTIVQSLEAIRIKLGGDSSYTCDSVQESIDGITNIYDDKMPASNSILSALNKLGEVVEPGSGGSSDFSTAEVTLINSGSAMGIGLYLCVVDDVNNSTDTTARLIVGTSKTFNAILYNGEAYASLYDSTSVDSYDGNIEPAGKNGYVITGDCTITIS